MGVTLMAAGIGLLIGLVAGGNPRNGFQHGWTLWPLLGVGLALQVLPEVVELSSTQSLLAILASYATLIVFCAANIWAMGISVVMIGLALNMVPIAINSGMPVERSALVSSGLAQSRELDLLDLGAKRHVASSSDRLVVLGDTIPLEALGTVISFGDLIVAFGVGNLMFRLLRPIGSRKRREDWYIEDHHVVDLVDDHLLSLKTSSCVEPLIDLTAQKPRFLEVTR